MPEEDDVEEISAAGGEEPADEPPIRIVPYDQTWPERFEQERKLLAVLGGMSQGGFLSLRAGLLAPARVRALVLIDTQAGGEDPERLPAYRQMQETWLQVGPVDDLANAIAGLIIGDPALSESWIAKWKALQLDSMRAPADCLFERDDITGRLGEISCPAIVFHGTADMSIEMDRAQELCDGLSGCESVVRIEGASHVSNLTHPGEVNGPLLDFLRSL